jgi:dihydrofolate reductase
MRLSLIVAVSENNVIGRDGDLPWHLSADLKRFKRLTRGHHIVMGRKTFESIGRMLPGRITVVVTRNAEYQAPGAIVAGSLDDALRRISGDSDVFIVGGAELYRNTLDQAARIYLTAVHADVDGDTCFPEVDWSRWSLLEDVRFAADDKNDHDYSFRVYDRKQSG